MKKILFVCPGAFGTLSDTLFYYENLKDQYNLTYFGFDESKIERKYDNIEIIHLKGSGNGIKNKIRFMINLIRLTKNNNYDFILINYFMGCSFLNFFLNRKYTVIDIRTGYIVSNKLKRIIFNSILNLEASLFKNITVISKSLKKHLNLPKSSLILPLGANSLNILRKVNKNLTFIYIGTFYQRNITKTISAFKLFLNTISLEKRDLIQYKIIGFGRNEDIIEINNKIKSLDLSKNVFFLGEIRYPELIPHLESSDFGVGYIPITKNFDNQPPTKIFEYLLSGMPVIATKTKENSKVINSTNGVLVKDDVESFASGFKELYRNRGRFSSKKIQNDSQRYTWSYIVKCSLIPIIEDLSK